MSSGLGTQNVTSRSCCHGVEEVRQQGTELDSVSDLEVDVDVGSRSNLPSAALPEPVVGGRQPLPKARGSH